MPTKTRYFQDADGHFIAVTDETPKGPLKGFVFAGRRLVGDETQDEAFGIDQIAKWAKLEIADIPPRCLAALGYCAPAPPPTEPEHIPDPVEAEAQDEDEGVNSEGGQIDHQPKPAPAARYGEAALGACLYLAAVYFFYWIKHA
jgi:hypothetical protein